MDRFVVIYELFGDWVRQGQPATMLDPYTIEQIEGRVILRSLRDDPLEMPTDLCQALDMPLGSTYGEAVAILGSAS